MLLHVWLTVVGICLLGAMSPGPSMALVLRHTLANGRRQGMICGIAHGTSIGLYAFLSVLGLAALITTSPLLFPALQLAGACYLIWLGLQGLRATKAEHQAMPTHPTGKAASSGFLMAFLNPKAALFFVALFSQVIDTATPLTGKLGYAATAMVIDMSWYVSVAWLFSRPRWLGRLERYSLWFERLFGVVLLAVAAAILLELV